MKDITNLDTFNLIKNEHEIVLLKFHAVWSSHVKISPPL
jgi:hypothetical protein